MWVFGEGQPVGLYPADARRASTRPTVATGTPSRELDWTPTHDAIKRRLLRCVGSSALTSTGGSRRSSDRDYAASMRRRGRGQPCKTYVDSSPGRRRLE